MKGVVLLGSGLPSEYSSMTSRRPMIPCPEIHHFQEIVAKAWHSASCGRLAHGYCCIADGLQRASEACRREEPWAEGLLEIYGRAQES